MTGVVADDRLPYDDAGVRLMLDDVGELGGVLRLDTNENRLGAPDGRRWNMGGEASDDEEGVAGDMSDPGPTGGGVLLLLGTTTTCEVSATSEWRRRACFAIYVRPLLHQYHMPTSQ